jgi:hypothetical protein
VRGAAQDLVRFLQTFVLLNLYKELGRHFIVSAAYYLTVADLNSAGLALNRDAAIAPVLAYQAFMSLIFRLEVSNYDDPRAALATCLLQGVLEVVMRVTAVGRDAWIKRRCGRATRERRVTALVISAASQGQPSSALDDKPGSTPSERVAALHERQAVVKQFHARMIVVDMWAEYAGIYIGTVILLLAQRAPMYYAFRPFRKHPELLDGDNYSGELMVGTLVQVAIEIVTDTVCLVYEKRHRGHEALDVWRKLPIALAPLVLLSLAFATYVGQVRSLYSDTTDACNFMDMCWCTGHGLQPGGLRESYCMQLYPNSSGVPSD